MVYPSTGLLAIFVALNHCHEVHIAGFGYPSNQSQNHPIHYYGYNTVKDMRVGKVSLSFSSFLSSTCKCTVCLPLGFRIAPITFSVKMKPWDTWRSWAPSSGFIHTDVCANSCIEKVKSKKKRLKSLPVSLGWCLKVLYFLVSEDGFIWYTSALNVFFILCLFHLNKGVIYSFKR